MRGGYNSSFLSGYKIALPEPGLTLKSDVFSNDACPSGVIDYIHYSVMMSKSTRQAYFSAANIDFKKMFTVSGDKGRKWFVDGRIGKNQQIPNYSYTNTFWDRGHLTRRTAVTWGDSEQEAIQASNDSCSYTNACMQHKRFNEDDWRAIETHVSDSQLADKLSVFTGPIFTQADRFYIKEFGDFPVRIPSGFWKIICFVKNNELKTQAYIFFQDIASIKNKDARKHLKLLNYRVTTTEIAHWTGLEFAAVLYDTNPLKFYSGPESISIEDQNDLLKKDPTALILDAGITDKESILKVRNKLPLNKFYQLVNDVSWI